jgi:tRNA (guanine10-N2)-dimethyltransferase
MTRACCLEAFDTNAEVESILAEARKFRFDDFLDVERSFAVRVLRVRGTAGNVEILALERDLGKIVAGGMKGLKANLKAPEQLLLGVLTKDMFLFGLCLVRPHPKGFTRRNPMKRPFFHPATLPAKLARCMVNLASPREGDLLLDPFCGGGSILVEGGLIGCRVLGLDVMRFMVRGAKKNLAYYRIEPEGLVVTDSRLMPVREADCIVTDPPYGRSASTLHSETKTIMEVLLKRLIDVAKGRIVAGSPDTVGLKKLGEEAGLKFMESHLIYIHRSLTREICTFEVT